MGVGLGIRSPVEFDLRCVTHFERDPEPVSQHSWPGCSVVWLLAGTTLGVLDFPAHVSPLPGNMPTL